MRLHDLSREKITIATTINDTTYGLFTVQGTDRGKRYEFSPSLREMAKVNDGGAETLHRMATLLRDCANSLDADAEALGVSLDNIR